MKKFKIGEKISVQSPWGELCATVINRTNNTITYERKHQNIGIIETANIIIKHLWCAEKDNTEEVESIIGWICHNKGNFDDGEYEEMYGFYFPNSR